MEQQGILGCSSPIWPEIDPNNIFSSGKCHLWIMAKQGVTEGIHFLYHYLFEETSLHACFQSLAIALEICCRLGVLVAIKKIEGPSSFISYLGLLIHTQKGEIPLPKEKLSHLLEELESWQGRKACTNRNLLSLISQFHHAALGVVPGRPFIWVLIELSKVPKHLNQVVWLNLSARKDIEWWLIFAWFWIRVTFLPFGQAWTSLTSDASGSWGWGAFWIDRWFQLQWADRLHPQDVSAKELVPILFGADLWVRW